MGAGHKAAGKGAANTDTGDDASDDNEEERRGKSDAWDEAEYDDKGDVLPVTAPFGVRQRDPRCLAEFNTAAVVVAHQLEFMQRAFPPQPANVGKAKTQSAADASIKACRPQSEVDHIVYILMHWQVGSGLLS